MSSDRGDIRTAERLNGLQVMRALGCLGIAFAHSAAFAEMAFPGMREGFTLNFWGRYGLLSLVTFFFAISGFLVAREVDTSEQGALTFLKKRAVRIYPTYWVGVVLAVFLFVITGVRTNFGHLLRGMLLLPIRDASFVLNGEWTLLHDIMFYLLSAPFFLLKKSRMSAYRCFLGVWLVVILGATHFLSIGYLPQMTFPNILFSRFNISLIAGALSYDLYRVSKKNQNISRLMKYAGLLSVGLYFINYEWFYQKSIIGEIIHYVLLLPIILGFLSMEVSGRNWLVAVGNCSYGIYLSH